MAALKRGTFRCVLDLRPLPGQSPTVCRLRLILKALLRQYGLESLGMIVEPVEAMESTGNEDSG